MRLEEEEEEEAGQMSTTLTVISCSVPDGSAMADGAD